MIIRPADRKADAIRIGAVPQLAQIGTDPAAQGQGGEAGSALLRARLETCDAEGVAACPASSKESDVPCYGKHGFQVTREIHLPDGPTVWAVLRGPVS
ncbi:hypothetical protein [Nonomuraea sp. NPDC003804]|uniref:GNAT family N-acetyltransferase n=1 Tax=Nonomuraea sp. NPDC003804 TaxID=3154547 RepID=UPI0033B77B86